MFRGWFAANHSGQATNALCRAVSHFFLGIVPIELDQHCVIDIGAERALYRCQICAMAVTRQLDAIFEAVGQIMNKC